MERVYGPYERKGKWRIIGESFVDGFRNRVSKTFETEAEARAALAAVVSKIEGRTIGRTVEEYIEHLLARGDRESGAKTQRYKLRALLCLPDEDAPLSSLTHNRVTRLYRNMAATYEPWTHRKALGHARTWARWAIKRGFLTSNPFADVESVGVLSAGCDRDKLGITESARLLSVCLEDKSPGALFVATLIVTGLREGELRCREVRDVDAMGSALWLRSRKTSDKERLVAIPIPALQRRLHEQAQSQERWLWGSGKSKAKPGPVTWGWVDKALRRMCKKAGVRRITAHALRGTFTTVAKMSGVAATAVANALDHSNIAEQDRSYAARGTSGIVDTRVVTDLLLRFAPVGRIMGERETLDALPQPKNEPDSPCGGVASGVKSRR